MTGRNARLRLLSRKKKTVVSHILTEMRRKCKAYFEIQSVPNEDSRKVQGAMQKSIISHISNVLFDARAHNLRNAAKTLGYGEKNFARLKICSG